jgi:O-antigen ligase
MIAMVLAWLSAVMALFSQISLEGISFSYRATPIEAGFGNPVDAGTHYAPVFTFIVWLALTATKRLGSCIWSICALTLTILLYLTWSRTAWLAGFVSVTFLLCFLAHRIVKKISIYAFVISIILLIIYEHQVVLSEIIGRGLTQRDIIWLNIIDRMQGYWLVGHGAGAKLGTFFLQDGFTVSHAHNLYLEVLYQYGLGGVILMLISSFACLVKLFRLRKDQLAALWFSLLVSGMLAMCFAMSNFVGTPNRIWVFYWLPLAGALAMPSSEKLRDVSYQCPV